MRNNKYITKYWYRLYTLFQYLFFNRGNKIFFHANGNSSLAKWWNLPDGLKIQFIGKNNTINIHNPVYFERVSIALHCENSTVDIGKNCSLKNTVMFLEYGNSTSIKIGKNCSTEGIYIISRGTTRLIVEDDCMFATNIIIRLTDSHPIYDRDSKKLLNEQKHPAVIGTHSWIGQHVCLTKNVVIPPHTIIGIGSVVCGTFTEAYTCLAGNPAKIVKRNVTWSREHMR